MRPPRVRRASATSPPSGARRARRIQHVQALRGVGDRRDRRGVDHGFPARVAGWRRSVMKQPARPAAAAVPAPPGRRVRRRRPAGSPRSRARCRRSPRWRRLRMLLEINRRSAAHQDLQVAWAGYRCRSPDVPTPAGDPVDPQQVAEPVRRQRSVGEGLDGWRDTAMTTAGWSGPRLDVVPGHMAADGRRRYGRAVESTGRSEIHRRVQPFVEVIAGTTDAGSTRWPFRSRWCCSPIST